MSSTSYDPVNDIFAKAKTEFLKELKDPGLRSKLRSATTIEDIWDYTDKLQRDQGNGRCLRGLNRIGPYIKRIQEYAGVVEVFTQVKPEIIALIWGPIKLLLQLSSNVVQSFDAILDVMKTLGPMLPQFDKFTTMFKENERMRYVLSLFFQDILDFYLVSLNFFSLGSWQILFEALWPAHRSKIEVIAQNIEKHGLLMCNEITMSDVMEAHAARLKAYKFYEEAREFQERQDFGSMEAYIRPPSYDEKLDRLRNLTCEGTGTWLQQDKNFQKWLDPKEKSVKVFWLQGIPGAGKTYLSSTVAEKTKELGHSTFAFLSYRRKSDTPLAIFHSLIFQLASQDRDLRAVLCYTIMSSTKELKRDLKGDSKFALQILAKLLKSAGLTYITIDGLDEVDDPTPQIFLHQCLGLLKECDNMKLFVSSRRVERIDRILKELAVTVSVDQNNFECIRTYARYRLKEWLDSSGFDDDARSEIQQLLNPLAAKANGMFLYARIVVESVEMLWDLDSIREQLEVLPESLDEAYERIIRKITMLPPASRNQSKKILSWIACSPIQITRREMEQALLIKPGNTAVPQVRATLNALQLCGPLVEERDGLLRFVHFTVKEYLLRRQEKSFIDEGEAIMDITTTCLTYLCSNFFDDDTTGESLQSNIISGAYRLLNFSYSQWTEFLKLCPRHFRQGPPDQLIDLLEQMTTDRTNLEYDNELETGLGTNALISCWEWPEAKEIVSRALDFHHRRLLSYDWQLSDTDSYWLRLDPTTISATKKRIYHLLESLLCSGSGHKKDCQCSELQKHYGQRLFKCPFVACRFHRMCFETRAVRNQHVEHHDRPFKCEVSSCEYSILGFVSREQYEIHRIQSHARLSELDVNENLDDLSSDELYHLSLDMIAKDDVDAMNRFYPHAKGKQYWDRVLDSVVTSGSVAMTKSLIGNGANWGRRTDLACKAIESSNIPVFRWICENSPIEISDVELKRRIASSGSTEVFEAWEGSGFKHTALVHWPVSNPIIDACVAALCTEQHALGKFTQKEINNALVDVVQGNCSLVLARALVECGANVNYRPNRNEATLTPLHWAARKTTADAAYLMEFLLLSGADPSIQVKIGGGKRKGELVTPSMEPGAKQISKWLGKTWEELVEWAAEKRKEQGDNGGPSDSHPGY